MEHKLLEAIITETMTQSTTQNTENDFEISGIFI